MVHRPVDSRLLTNVLSQEKEYSKHLASLLDQSHASVASFSAYASASSPPTSNVILAVAGTLANADEALRRYASAVEECSAHLKGLKELEDEVGNILRDREILVTRLIKASKSSKPTSSNRLSFTLQPTSSLTSLQSSGSSPLPLPGAFPASSASSFSTLGSQSPNPLHTSQKLSAAQSELQACETHLALKERQLAERRAGAVREGMSVRLRALVECGWVWGEMGKEGLRALDELAPGAQVQSQITGQNVARSATTYPNGTVKPLPDHPSRPGSDLSSLAPSQSASQIEPNNAGSSSYSHSQDHGTGTGTFHLPPAHAITDSEGHFYPYAPSGPAPSTGMGGGDAAAATGTGATSPRHVLSRRITEEELATIASSSRDGHSHDAAAAPPPPPPSEKPSTQPPPHQASAQAQEDQVQEEEIITNDDSSSVNEPTPPTETLQVVENPRYAPPPPASAPPTNGSKISLTRSTKPQPLPPTDKSATYAPLGSPHRPHRRFGLGTGAGAQNRRESYDSSAAGSQAGDHHSTGKSGFFGSLGRSLFGGRKKDKEREREGSEVSTNINHNVPPSPSKRVIDLNASPTAGRPRPRLVGTGAYAREEEEDSSDEEGEADSDDERGTGRDGRAGGRKGIKGLFHHSNNSGSGAGGGKKWDMRTDRNLHALENPRKHGFGVGHRRAGSVDQVNNIPAPIRHVDGPDLWEVVASAGRAGPTSTPRKRVASDVGYRTPPRLASASATSLTNNASSSPTSPTSPTRPGMARSPSDSSANSGARVGRGGGRKLKKRSPSSTGMQVPTLATIQSGRSEEGHGEAVAVAVGAEGGKEVKRSKSTKSVGGKARRSSSVPPTTTATTTTTTAYIAGVPTTATPSQHSGGKTATQIPAQVQGPSAVPNQITTHHAGGVVLVTALPSSSSAPSNSNAHNLTASHPTAGANLSRNSSLASAASAPPLLLVSAPSSGGAASAGQASAGKRGGTRHGGSALGVAGERSTRGVATGGQGQGQGHVRRSASVNVPNTAHQQKHHHQQPHSQQTQTQAFVIPSAPPPASASVHGPGSGTGTKPAASTAAGAARPLSTGMEVKAPRRVEREELEKEVQGASGSGSGGHHTSHAQHQHIGGTGHGVTRGRSLERLSGDEGGGSRRGAGHDQQKQHSKKQATMEVPSAPKSVFETQTPGAGASGAHHQHMSTPSTSAASVAGSSSRASMTPAGTSTPTPLAVAAPQPRPAVSTPSSSIFPSGPIAQPTHPATPPHHHPQLGNTLSPSPSLHRQHDKSPLRSALKNGGSGSGSSRSPSPEKTPSHRSQSPLKSALKNTSSTTNVHLGVSQPPGGGVSRTPSPLALSAGSTTPAAIQAPPRVASPAPAPAPIPRPTTTTSPAPDGGKADLSRRLSIASVVTDDGDDAEYETADEAEGGDPSEEATPTHTTIPLPLPVHTVNIEIVQPTPTPPQSNGYAIHAPSPAPIPSPVPSPSPAVALSAQTSEEGSVVGSGSAASGEGAVVKRRKSVRVSLQPTFTPTPPAIEYSDEEEEAAARAPWGGAGRGGGEEKQGGGRGGVENGKGNGKGKEKMGKNRDENAGKALPTPDLWEDSSEEDVEYSRARKLLMRMGRKGSGKPHHR